MHPHFSLAAALIIVAVANATAQAPPPSVPGTASPPAQQRSSQAQESRTPQQSLTTASEPELAQEVENLQQQVNSLKNFITIGITVGGTAILVFLGLGAAGSLFSLTRYEKRADEAHTLAIKGETAAQKRADEVHTGFFEGSKITLGLVNDTLTLAKNASERAAKILEDKARGQLNALDDEAKTLVLSVPSGNDRALVADSELRSSLMDLAQKLSAFEINSFILPGDFKLTPHCMFIRGIENHLKQQFKVAISFWSLVAINDSAEPSLRSLAWYWIGMEHNNLGHFPQAVSSFQQALERSNVSRSYELHRILIESRFFNKEEPEDLVPSLEKLLADIGEPQSEEIKNSRQRIFVTLGNILHIMGEGSRKAGNRQEAERLFQKAAENFKKASKEDKWARFGLAEALFRDGKVDEALNMFETAVLSDARKGSTDRMEPRIKLLGRVTEMICCVRIPRLRDHLEQIHSQAIESLGDVDERLTIYSQVQRRNVSREEFISDLALLETEG